MSCQSLFAPSSPLSPSSPFAASIARLFEITLVVCAVIGFGVAAAIAYSLFAFRARPGGGEPPQVNGNRKLEILWTVVPIAIVAGLFVHDPRDDGRVRPAGRSARPTSSSSGTSGGGRRATRRASSPPTRSTSPTGKPLLVRLESADVIHDFWVPQLARKMDAVPGHPNFFWMSADAPGAYGGACAEYCGTQHAWMRLLVVAESAGGVRRVAGRTARARGALRSPQAPRAGKRVFHDEACGNCHAITGRGFDGHVAPDLTHLATRSTLGAGVAERHARRPDRVAPRSRSRSSPAPTCRTSS